MRYVVVIVTIVCLAFTVCSLASQDGEPKKGWDAFEWSKLLQQQEESGRAYLRFLKVPTLNCGVYALRKGETDGQIPHRQDEMYYVVEGQGRFTVGGADLEVKPGSILYVKAGVEHRFYDITEDVKLLVFFSAAAG